MRVLLVEDEMLVALDEQLILADAGHEVVGPAMTVEEALALVDGERLDAAILDVNLGGVMVWPVAERLAARGVPHLFLTGFGSALEMPQACRAAPRLGKPVNGRLLVQALDGLLERA